MPEDTLVNGGRVVVVKGAYLTLGMVAAAHAVNHAYAALLSLLYPAMMAELSFNYSQLGVLIAISRAFGQGFQWAAGYLGRLVRRKTLLGIGTVLQGLFMAVTGIANTFGQLLAWQTVTRLAGSPQHPNGNALILKYFGRESRGKVLAVHYSGGNVGTVIVPLLTAVLLAAYGWRITLLVVGVPGILIGLLLLLLVRENGDGAEEVVPEGRRRKISWGRETLQVLKNRNVRLIIAAQATGAGGRGLGIVLTFVPLYLSQHLGMSTLRTGFLFTMMTIGSVVGPMLAGIISDRISQRKHVLITTYFLSTLATVALVHLGSLVWLLPVILFLMGCFVYSESPMLQSLTADATETVSQDTVFGLYFTFGFGSSALWALLIGYLVETFGFVPAFYVMAASYTAAALWLFPLRPSPPGLPSQQRLIHTTILE